MHKVLYRKATQACYFMLRILSAQILLWFEVVTHRYQNSTQCRGHT